MCFIIDVFVFCLILLRRFFGWKNWIGSIFLVYRSLNYPLLSNFQFQTICRSQRSAHASLQRLNSTAGVLAQDLSQQVLEVKLVILFDLPSQFSIPTMKSYCCLQKESWSWFVDDPFSFLYCFSLNSVFDVLVCLAGAF